MRIFHQKTAGTLLKTISLCMILTCFITDQSMANPNSFDFDIVQPLNLGLPQNANWVCTIRPQIAQKTVSALPLAASDYLQEVQYFDGAGMVYKTVQLNASPAQKNISTQQEYDSYNRLVRQSLPYIDVNNNSNPDSFYANLSPSFGIAADEYPCSENVYINTRSEIKYGPGQEWHPHYRDKYQITNIHSNVANEVRLWTATDTQVSSSSCYDAGKLYVTESIDEDGRTAKTYTDLHGRILRQVQVSAMGNAVTDFVYDSRGRKVYVLPPAINKGGSFTITFTTSSTDFSRFIYAYRYDDRNREVEKHIPGAGWTYTIYNKLDKPILTQDADQRTRYEWSFVKYDAFGRVAYTGLYTNTFYTTRAAMQTLVNEGANSLWESRQVNTEWSNDTFPNTNGLNTVIHTVNYYDNYNFSGKETYSGAGVDTRVKGMQTGSKIKVLDNTPYDLISTMYYDKKGRLIHTIANQPRVAGLTVKDELTNTYKFTGLLLTTTRKHYRDGSVMFTQTTTNTYDHAGRLKTTKQNMGSGDVTVSANDYNEVGQLIKTTLNGGQEIINYSYNIRGWLTEINNGKFSEKLHYQNAVTGLSNTQQWAGNISAMEWKTTTPNTFWHAYSFVYDNLNRLTAGNYNSTGSNGSYGTNKDYYNENYKYDIMGNILELNRRYGNLETKLKYTYNGNRLSTMSGGETWPSMITLSGATAPGVYTATNSIVLKPGFNYKTAANPNKTITLNTNPSLTSPSPQYVYSAAGRMTNDNHRGIDIQYNHLGLVKQIDRKGQTKGQTMKHLYDATGRKVRTSLPDNTTRNYIDGVEYKNGVIEFISTPQGRIRQSGSNWVYDYFLKDHLGNVRVVLQSNGTVLEVNAYYPYGKIIPGLSKTNITAPNNYKYNGKELQTELGLDWLNYGARMLSNRELPVWLTIDPLAELRPHESPYSAFGNNPIRNVDPDGRYWVNSSDSVYAGQLQQEMGNKAKSEQKSLDRLNSKIAKNQEKGKDVSKDQAKAAGMQANIDNLNAGISELTAMGATTEQGFTYKMTDNDVGYAYMENGVIVMEIANNGSVSNGLHESSHGYDIWQNGAYTKGNVLAGESKAYGREFSFGTAIPSSDWYKPIKSLSDINGSYVLGIRHNNEYLYGKIYHGLTYDYKRMQRAFRTARKNQW